MSKMRALFNRDIIYTRKDGRHEIKCRLGLWAVSAADFVTAKCEAWHCYRQRYADGKYNVAMKIEEILSRNDLCDEAKTLLKEALKAQTDENYTLNEPTLFDRE